MTGPLNVRRIRYGMVGGEDKAPLSGLCIASRPVWMIDTS